ncbi:MAG: 2-oxo acid dehydrogenase subunit E2 [Candidatus Nanohaloarchaea archaeon]
MAEEFEFPDTGEGVTEGKFLEWLVDEGEDVEEDQSVAEVETDKAVVEIPAPSNGTIKALKVKPGDTVKVGQVIMTIETGESGGKEETVEESEPDTEVEEVEEKQERTPEKKTEPRTSAATSGDVLALPKVRKLAREKGVDLASIKTGERITEEEVRKATSSGDTGTRTTKSRSTDTESTPEDVKATPSVRKLAREKGVNLDNVKGSGRGGKITREDVLSAESGGGTKTSSTEHGEVERVEMTATRRTIADRMEESKFTAPHVTHIDTADVTRLAEMREEVKDRYDAHLTYLPFIMKASVQALKDYPDLNAELDEENSEILRKKFYDFNIAVDTERGLMVPVVEDVDEKNMVELAGAIVDQVEKAQEGSLRREDMEGGTFSITNIGAIGGEGFTPIINYPQVAILGVGKIQETPQVVDGEIVPRTTVKLSLSYDHRVVDGATAARFLNEIKERLEKPEDMMVNL